MRKGTVSESPRIGVICIDRETFGGCMNSYKLGKVDCIKEKWTEKKPIYNLYLNVEKE